MRVTQDVVELRRWAESRGGRPCRDAATGRLGLSFGGEPCAVPVGWDEFEPAFLFSHGVFAYEDAPGSRRFFLGSEEEAHAWVAAEIAAAPRA